MSEVHAPQDAVHKSVTIWLIAIYAMIFLMVIIGGITRLTGSGLSMVQWHPFMGALPPMDEAQWMEVFGQYQKTPQYQQVNHWMALGDFKQIFMWEYIHRLWGRLIGLVFFVPWVFLLMRKRISGPLVLHTSVAFILGGLQGLLGWYMVKSGLVDIPEVSHYRLAAHLCLALLVAHYILWLILDIVFSKRESGSRAISRAAWTLLVLISLQIVYGAFMAGQHAGVLSGTFPDMNGAFMPSEAWSMSPTWLNLFDNPITVHFIHRTLGWCVLIAVLAFFFFAKPHNQTPRQKWANRLILGAMTLQFALGVATVMLYVPITIAVMHQAGGMLLLSAAVFAVHCFRGQGLSEPAVAVAVNPRDPNT